MTTTFHLSSMITPLRLVLGAAALMQILSGSALASYKIAAGDVVELAVAGVPELKQRSTVSIDGVVTFALLGQLRVTGQSMAELQSNIQQALSTKLYFQRSSDGRDNRIILEPDAITVTIAEYRPIYVNGDVAKPGEQPYRPGMTVRQALAVAGGHSFAPNRAPSPIYQAADIRSEYIVLSAQLAKEQAYAKRLKVELGMPDDPEPNQNKGALIQPHLASQISDLQTQQLNARKADYENEKNYLQVAIQQSSKRLAVLSEQQKKELQGEEADIEDMQRVEALFQKGAVPITRITEARRVSLLSATRRLETAAQIAQVEREREDFQRRLQKLDDQRRLDTMKELDEANFRLVSVRSRLQAAGEKLLYSGSARAQLMGGENSKPDILIFRKENENIPGQVVADLNTELQPGDVIEVTLKSEVITGSLVR